jgi:atypical dual specificity phosphatase
LQVRLLIDLTAKEYFTKEEVKDHGIDYVKIKAGFGDRTPSPDAVEEFIQTVQEFVGEHGEDEEIAVVCTYGTNRGGYLICRYLMDMEEDMGPTEAIETFETARGQPFPADKPNLKRSLQRRDWIV